MTADPVLLVAEVAEELRCSTRYVTLLCSRGDLRAFRVGKTWRICRSAVDEYKSQRSAA